MIDDPFSDDQIEEIPLRLAPLVKVVAQLHFPLIAKISDHGFIAPFQERIRAEYPIMRQEQQISMVMTPAGPISRDAEVVWRLHDVDENWTVSLAPGFVALEVDRYTSRSDFLARWRTVLEALTAFGAPAVYDRMGIRYVDQLTGDDAGVSLRSLVRGEVYGALMLESMPSCDLVASLTQSTFKLDGSEMQARWGKMPAGAMVPGLQPTDVPSWILDIDVAFAGTAPFNIDHLIEASTHGARHAYKFFRWAITDAFVERFKGDDSDQAS